MQVQAQVRRKGTVFNQSIRCRMRGRCREGTHHDHNVAYGTRCISFKHDDIVIVGHGVEVPSLVVQSGISQYHICMLCRGINPGIKREMTVLVTPDACRRGKVWNLLFNLARNLHYQKARSVSDMRARAT